MDTPDEPIDEPHEAYGLSSLYSFSYCSRAAAGVDEAEVGRIIATARRHNPRLGITGLLVFGGGIFFQWLEGPRASVSGLVQRLNADPRHDSIVTLDESEEVRERLFPDWDMELVGAMDIREVLADALRNSASPINRDALQRLVGRLDSGELAV